MTEELVEARYYKSIGSSECICLLCPRGCRLANSQVGACGVRKNIEGKMFTLNYNKCVAFAQEFIESEAVFHYEPGSEILSLGNPGCNLTCDFCQNWTTSQVKYIEPKDVKEISVDAIIENALKRQISILSWTYNDPVVWHEFVVDAAREAKKYGLINLYKSAFYINSAPIDELIEVMDIFSISLKSLDHDFYKKFCGARLDVVLDGIKQVYQSNRHLEISNLVVTHRNDNLESVKWLIDWVLTELGPGIPLHFVRFHPAYKYTETGRTSIQTLENCVKLAKEMGVKYCYLGNVLGTDYSHSYCSQCHQLLVHRYGLITTVKGIDEAGRCKNCGADVPIKISSKKRTGIQFRESVHQVNSTFKYMWNEEVNALHVEGINRSDKERYVCYRPIDSNGDRLDVKRVLFIPGQNWRFLISRSSEKETGVLIEIEEEIDAQVHELLDRAHLPVNKN